MKLIRVKNYKELSKKASEILIREINKKPNLVVGFATGKTPLGLYKELVRAYKRKKVDFSKLIAFDIDEYFPVEKKNKKSFYYYMHKNFFSKVNIEKRNINLLNGETRNIKKECERFEKKIKKNVFDVLILGVGVNGHIAFNEPGSSFQSKTRLVDLRKETIKRNFGLLSRKVPSKALTIGIKTIMSARKIILLASGKSKAEAIKHLIRGKPNNKWPVTALKRHKNLVVVVDKGGLR